jgi:hypothetical protein
MGRLSSSKDAEWADFSPSVKPRHCTILRNQTINSSKQHVLMKTWPERDPQQIAQRVCECGRSYIGETGRYLAVRLREHEHSLKEGLYYYLF